MTGSGDGGGDALFLDFDGTLVDIADRPDSVHVPSELADVLAGLRLRLDGALAIVTGRPLSAIDGFLPGLAPDGAGLHGLERRVDGRTLPLDLPSIAPFIRALEGRFIGRPGVVIEDKGIGVAVHWRMAPEAEAEVRDAVDETARRLGPDYRIQDGKAVREIVPTSSGKGEGIRALMRLEPYVGRRPVFVGDDRTDEHGFEAVIALGGVTVKVGGGPSSAGRRLATPTAVRAWLREWLHGRSRPDLLPLAAGNQG